jgi:hypothetical protein
MPSPGSDSWRIVRLCNSIMVLQRRVPNLSHATNELSGLETPVLFDWHAFNV